MEPWDKADDYDRPCNERELSDAEVDAIIAERQQREVDARVDKFMATYHDPLIARLEENMLESMDKISDAVIALKAAGEWE